MRGMAKEVLRWTWWSIAELLRWAQWSKQWRARLGESGKVERSSDGHG